MLVYLVIITFLNSWLFLANCIPVELQLSRAISLIYGPELQENENSNKNLYIYVHQEFDENRYHLMDLATLLLQAFEAKPHTVNFKQCSHTNIPQENFMLVLVDTVLALRYIYARQLATSNLSYTLVYIAGLHDAQHTQLEEALQLLWQLSVLNLGIVLRLPEEHSEFVLITYFPFGVDECRSVRPMIINRYDRQLNEWMTTVRFPTKLKNFHGCPLTCATWEDMPYLKVERTDDDTSLIGIEGSLLEFMANELNFSIDLYMLNKTEITATFNETGWVFSQIFKNSVDYAIGAFYKKPLQTQISFSQSSTYFLSHIMLVVNLPHAFSTYEKLAYPFEPNVWLTICLIFLLGSLVLSLSYTTTHHRRHFILGLKNKTPFYNMLVLAVGASLQFRSVPRRNFARYLLGLWLFVTLVMRSAYQSGMYKLLRDNTHRDPPNSIASVLEKNYTVAMTPENVRFLGSLPELKSHQYEILNSSELEIFQSLVDVETEEQQHQRHMAIITPYEYFGYFRRLNKKNHSNIPHVNRQHLHLINERIFTQQLTFYVRENSYLVEVINEQIRKAQYYGFSIYWSRRHISEITDIDDYIDFAESESSVLSMKELEAIFWIVLWMHLFAGLIFLLELLLTAWKNSSWLVFLKQKITVIKPLP